MFDGGSSEINENAANATIGEADWKNLHQRLRSIARRRVALEAEEAGLLLEAEESRLYRRLGYTTMHEYMERELHYGPHAANERLRVAHALVELPLIAELFGEGEICFSAVRELTRVATPATEQAFLHKAQGKTAHRRTQAGGLARCQARPTPDQTPAGHRSLGRNLRRVAANTGGPRRRTGRTVVRRRRDSDAMPARHRNVPDQRGRLATRGPDRGHHVQGVQAELHRVCRRGAANRSSDSCAAHLRCRAYRRPRERRAHPRDLRDPSSDPPQGVPPRSLRLRDARLPRDPIPRSSPHPTSRGWRRSLDVKCLCVVLRLPSAAPRGPVDHHRARAGPPPVHLEA